jgi:RNA polymerase sigma-70 factor (ECF subfamily)
MIEQSDRWLREMYIQYKDKIYRYMYKKLRSRENAEDLTSQVFIELTRSKDRFDETKSAQSTWIYAISRNILNRYLRDTYTRNHILQTAFNDAPLYDSDTVNKIVQQDEFIQVLEELSETARTIILMEYYHGLSLKEIAERLHLTYDNVCVIKSRALKVLREHLLG